MHLYNRLCPSVGWSVGRVTHSFDDPPGAPYWPTWPCLKVYNLVDRNFSRTGNVFTWRIHSWPTDQPTRIPSYRVVWNVHATKEANKQERDKKLPKLWYHHWELQCNSFHLETRPDTRPIPVADGWAGAVMQKPLGIQRCDGRTDGPTDRHGKV